MFVSKVYFDKAIFSRFLIKNIGERKMGVRAKQETNKSLNFQYLFKLALICFMGDIGYEKQSLKEQQRQRLKELESEVQMHQKQIHLLEKQMEVLKQKFGDDPQSPTVTFSLTAQRTSQACLGTTAEDLEIDSLKHQSKKQGLHFTSI